MRNFLSVMPDLQSGIRFRILNVHTRCCQITNLAGRAKFGKTGTKYFSQIKKNVSFAENYHQISWLIISTQRMI